MLVRLDGLYGDAAPLLDVLTADLGVIVRSRAYHLLDLEVVKQALARSPDQVSTHPENGMRRALYDCPTVPLTPSGPERGFDIINAYSLAFFDQHLEGHPATLLDGPSKNYPEVIFSARSAA
jgi:hypothetical protein